VGWQQRLKEEEEEEEEKYRREEEEEGPLLEGKKKKGKSSKGGRRSIGLKLMDVSGFLFYFGKCRKYGASFASVGEQLYIFLLSMCIQHSSALELLLRPLRKI
jgi:hypothetical protein